MLGLDYVILFSFSLILRYGVSLWPYSGITAVLVYYVSIRGEDPKFFSSDLAQLKKKIRIRIRPKFEMKKNYYISGRQT